MTFCFCLFLSCWLIRNRVLKSLQRLLVVKFLSDFAHYLEEGFLLHHVRTLRFYLKRTKGLSHSSSALFVSPRCLRRAISKNTISYFLREIISGTGAVRVSKLNPWGLQHQGYFGLSSFYEKPVGFHGVWSCNMEIQLGVLFLLLKVLMKVLT